MYTPCSLSYFFFFNDPATTEIYTLSLHDALPIYPNFAMAYGAVGVHYYNLGEPARAGEYLAKAFQLREHASERERLAITANYYSSVSGELDKAAQTYQEKIGSYPREVRSEERRVGKEERYT